MAWPRSRLHERNLLGGNGLLALRDAEVARGRQSPLSPDEPFVGHVGPDYE